MLKEGTVEQLAHGVYRYAEDDYLDEDCFRSATLRVGNKSAICMISALVFYDLIDEIPKKTWIMVPFQKRTSHKDLRTFRCRNPKWNIGIEQKTGYSITSIERTLVEALVYKSKLGTALGVTALRKATRMKKTTLKAVMDVAISLDVTHRVRPYIEAIA